MITIKHLRKEYENVTPLKDVNAEINEGDVISIIGPSGTGKSTFLRCINMLESPTSGEIYVDGELITAKGCDLSKVRRKMGMVFQSFNLFNHMTVIENVMAAQVDVLGRTRQQAYDKAMELLRTVGLADKMYNYPSDMSGGQKQRVAIARALAMEPQIILFDEPTSALDPTMVGEVQTVIRDLAKKGMTMMIVTHEMRFAREVANRVFYMDDGGIYEDGTPEQIFDAPQRERTIQFIRHLKTFETIADTKTFDFIGAVSHIDEFGRKHGISQRTIYHIQTVYEEVCMQLLLPRLPDKFKLSSTIEYSPDDETALLRFKYSGERFNAIEDADNELSATIVKRTARSVEYKQIDEGEYQNQLTVTIDREAGKTV